MMSSVFVRASVGISIVLLLLVAIESLLSNYSNIISGDMMMMLQTSVNDDPFLLGRGGLNASINQFTIKEIVNGIDDGIDALAAVATTSSTSMATTASTSATTTSKTNDSNRFLKANDYDDDFYGFIVELTNRYELSDESKVSKEEIVFVLLCL